MMGDVDVLGREKQKHMHKTTLFLCLPSSSEQLQTNENSEPSN